MSKLSLFGAVAAGLVLTACGPKEQQSQANIQQPVLPNSSGIPAQQHNQQQINIIRGYNRQKETVELGPDGRVITCTLETRDVPLITASPDIPNTSVQEQIEKPVNPWLERLKNLQHINVKGDVIPVLKYRDLPADQLALLEQFYNEPDILERKLAEMGIEAPSSEPIKALFIDYRTVRNHFYDPEKGCELNNYNDPQFDPQQSIDGLIEYLRESTFGYVNFELAQTLQISEQELPLTEDPQFGPKYLLRMYGRTTNYAKIVELAKQAGVNVVFVMTGDSAGMDESYVASDGTVIFGLNYNQPLGNAVESFVHFVEEVEVQSQAAKLFEVYTGGTDEYDNPPPFLTSEQITEIASLVPKSARGLGSVHYSPGSFNAYNNQQVAKFVLPGSTQSFESNIWGGRQEGFLGYWLDSLPKRFYTLVQEALKGRFRIHN